MTETLLSETQSGPSVFSSRRNCLKIAGVEAPSLLTPGYRHPSLAVPLEVPIFDGSEQQYFSPLTREEYDRRMNVMGLWLLENRIASPNLVEIGKKFQLTRESVRLMKDNPEDKGILVYSYLLAEEEYYNQLGKSLTFGVPGTPERYDLAQKGWWAVGIEMFRTKYGKWPSSLERFNILYDQIRLPFRAYFVLKEVALKELGQKVEYSWSRSAIEHVNREVHAEI